MCVWEKIEMPIEMPRGLPFSVDTWTPYSNGRKRHHFLTHAHKDHSQGITTHASYPIYSTHLTKSLLLLHYPQLDDSLFVCIEVGESLVLDDPDGPFTVTAFDANHCPGAVMFLFEGYFGNILHTGDCRLTIECLQSLPEKYIGRKAKAPRCRLDCIFLDCTFGRFPSSMPSRELAIQQVINCIWKHPNSSVVYFSCDLLGQVEVLVNVSKIFGCKIYVDKEKNTECFQSLALIVPEVLSSDPCSRFQIFDGFHKMYERAQAKILEARAKSHEEPLIIRPSVQWYACEEGSSEADKTKKERFDQAVRDMFGVWHVCYSTHSSREELEWALQLLAPKWVVSTTPSCRAMELQYVKKHCFTSKLTSDDPLWRLLDIGLEDSSDPDALVEGLSSTVAETNSINYIRPETQPTIKPGSPGNLLNLSPPSKKPPSILSSPSKRPCLTLFGRARLGHYDSASKHDQEEMISISRDSDSKSEISGTAEILSFRDGDSKSEVSDRAEKFSVQNEEAVEVGHRSLEEKVKIDTSETKCNAVQRETKNRPYDFCIGSSRGFNESLRRFYRSMNVPVPQPLPSLVGLMNANKHSKRMF